MSRARHCRWSAAIPPIMAIAAFCCDIAHAQQPAPAPAAQADLLANPVAAYNRIVSHLNAGEYDAGLALADDVLRYWGNKGKEQFGAGFGHFHYLRGLLLMGSERYPEAIEAFRITYEGFPNDPANVGGVGGTTKLANRFLIHALAQWGACLMMTGDYAGAIEKLKLALEKSPGTRIRTDAIALNLGRCLVRNGDLAEGKTLLLKALASTTLAADMKRRAFMILAEDWSPLVPLDEVLPLIWEHSELMRRDTDAARWERNRVFAHLARTALQKEDPLRAFAWYDLFLPPQRRVEYWASREAELSRVPVPSDAASQARLDAAREEAKTQLAGARDAQAALLLGLGAGHFQTANVSAAYAAYLEIVERHPGHPQRPDAFYNLIAASAHLARLPDIRTFGNRFLDEYPEHPLVAEVARLMVESIYVMEEWEEARKTGVALRERFPEGSVAADVPDFVAAACLYHVNQHAEAIAELGAYLKRYSTPRRAEPATYFLGASHMQVFQWKEGVAILEKFEESFPHSSLRPSALYQSALGTFALGDLDAAAAKTIRLREGWPDATEIAASWNLEGDILSARQGSPRDDIAAAYRNARELATKNPDLREVGAYAVWKLIVHHAAADEHPDAAALYDTFRAEFPGSARETDAVAAAARSLAETGRRADADTALRELILRFADDPGPVLGEIFGSWLAFIKEDADPDKTLAALRKFAPPADGAIPLRAWLAIGEAELLESRGDQAPKSEIDDLFYRLQFDLPREQTPNYPLIKLARRISSRGDVGKAREALEFIIAERPAGGHLEIAMADLAGHLGKSEIESDRDRALAYYAEIRQRFDLPSLRESATLGGARLESERGRYQEAIAWWRDYLREEEWVSARAEANFQFGRCLEEVGRPAEALKLYVGVYANYPGHLDWSTAAYLRTADLLKKSKKDGDALLVMVDMLKRLGHLQHPNIDRGREKFAQWKAEWVGTKPAGS